LHDLVVLSTKFAQDRTKLLSPGNVLFLRLSQTLLD
jgi:hypothetical protein